MSILSPTEAREAGYSEAFIAYPALGDQLLLLYAAKIKYSATGKKTLLGTNAPELFSNLLFCDLVEGLDALTVARSFDGLQKSGISVHPVTYYIPRKTPDGQIRFSFPKQHMLAEMCSRLGGKGPVALLPEFELGEEERTFGRFFPDTQIAIMSQGKEKRKSWGVENIQSLIATLKGRYNFVQIGASTDPLLQGALDKRGAFPLRQVAAVLHNSDLFIGGIGALMHLARGVNCRSVITYSLSEPFHADSYPCNCNVLAPEGCCRCQENSIVNDALCVDNFSCIRNIQPAAVLAAVDSALQEPRGSELETTVAAIVPSKAAPLNLLTARLFAAAQSQKFTMRPSVPNK